MGITILVLTPWGVERGRGLKLSMPIQVFRILPLLLPKKGIGVKVEKNELPILLHSPKT
jgi:hypothetical protein